MSSSTGLSSVLPPFPYPASSQSWSLCPHNYCLCHLQHSLPVFIFQFLSVFSPSHVVPFPTLCHKLSPVLLNASCALLFLPLGVLLSCVALALAGGLLEHQGNNFGTGVCACGLSTLSWQQQTHSNQCLLNDGSHITGFSNKQCPELK